MQESEYLAHDATGLAALVAAGEVSPAELLDAALARTAEVNPVVNAVVHPMEAQARAQLATVTPGSGPLAGVPYLLKDLTAMYAGVPTSHGSRFLGDVLPDYDTEVVARLKAAGLVIFGKTNTPELGGAPTTEPQRFGPARNPWHTGHSTGGSSGGSAAAVAAGIVPACHATDGGGSIRIPASCCGVFGLKPSRGRNPAGPRLGEIWAGMSAEHAVTRTVRDSAALLDVTSGPAVGDPYACPPPVRPFAAEVGRDPGRLRIAASAAVADGITVHPDVLATFAEAVAHLRGLGHEVDEVAPAYDATATSAAVVKIIAVNYARSIARHAAVKGREPEPGELERVIERRRAVGRAVPATEYVEAVETIHRAGRDVGAFLGTYDVILRPTVAQPPPPLGYLDMNAEDLDGFLTRLWSYIPYTSVFNATGLPAASVPFGRSADGLPLGIQLAARYGDEATLFRLAAQIEATRPWSLPPMTVGAVRA
ncbi:amidase [Micromonospora cathayae]|uniref:Amidase n=1 Tax=Micromonospora cathayae TaxID=3028804 RepID=A0ABY7ZMZ4_9ACTN|nr:amidase [Micromonospora sp. HUAS 3]WDZ83801.1 amidase [Micromonospora sp. HUAS 3]